MESQMTAGVKILCTLSLHVANANAGASCLTNHMTASTYTVIVEWSSDVVLKGSSVN